MLPSDVDTDAVGRCAKCGTLSTRDAYAPCNLGSDVTFKCGGACHAKRDSLGEFRGFCGPLVFGAKESTMPADEKPLTRDDIKTGARVRDRHGDEWEILTVSEDGGEVRLAGRDYDERSVENMLFNTFTFVGPDPRDARIAALETALEEALEAVSLMTGFVEASYYAEKYEITATVTRLRALLPTPRNP